MAGRPWDAALERRSADLSFFMPNEERFSLKSFTEIGLRFGDAVSPLSRSSAAKTSGSKGCMDELCE